jgi:bifunctional non-homologous end joining protein LigD
MDRHAKAHAMKLPEPARPKARVRKAAAKISAKASLKALAGAASGPLPAFVEPCLATLVARLPEDEGWVHEVKFDGYRIEARIDRGNVRLLTRTGLDWTERFGTLPILLGEMHRGTALIDGEIVVEDDVGRSSFTALAEALKSGKSSKFVLQCFDLLHVDGFDLVGADLLARKAALRQLIGKSNGASTSRQIRFSDHLTGDGTRMLEGACALGLEGIISKRADRPYRSGRHDDWRKSKCIQVDEFVIIGYLVSTVSPKAIGALVVGYYDKKRLVYAGRVGTGYSQQVAQWLMRRLKPLRIEEPEFATPLSGLQRRGVVWIRPEVVAQIEYRAWTADGLLRHAAFKAVREDKPAKDVRRPVVKS